MPKLDKNEEAVMGILFGLADSVADAPSSEILEEAKKNCVNLLDEAEEVRGILRSAGRSYLRRKLQESREAYEVARQEIREHRCDLPNSESERRQLLEGILRERPEFGPIVMTAQYRNFAELSDEDVASFLKQLKILGLLDMPTSPANR